MFEFCFIDFGLWLSDDKIILRARPLCAIFFRTANVDEGVQWFGVLEPEKIFGSGRRAAGRL